MFYQIIVRLISVVFCVNAITVDQSNNNEIGKEYDITKSALFKKNCL